MINIMAKDDWQIIRTLNPKKGLFIVINHHNHLAYFKCVSKKRPLPAPANEILAYLLAIRLNLPTAKTQLAYVEGTAGILIFPVPGQGYPWERLTREERADLEQSFFHPRELIKVLVFDTWIINDDRTRRNLFYTRLPGESKYRFFLIDHGASLLSLRRRNEKTWQEAKWNLVEQFARITDITGQIGTINDLEQPISQIEAIGDSEIFTIVNQIPEEFLSPLLARATIELLITRRDALRKMFAQWCRRTERSLEPSSFYLK